MKILSSWRAWGYSINVMFVSIMGVLSSPDNSTRFKASSVKTSSKSTKVVVRGYGRTAVEGVRRLKQGVHELGGSRKRRVVIESLLRFGVGRWHGVIISMKLLGDSKFRYDAPYLVESLFVTVWTPEICRSEASSTKTQSAPSQFTRVVSEVIKRRLRLAQIKGGYNWNKSRSIVMSQGAVDLAVELELVMLNLQAGNDPE
ncbi:hypothetical protein BDR03DRAFT_996397 [Suillus americanus]|nr:hypothetical protein BDR03DRAFT_996397 [Suillus americanus]